MVAAPTLSQRFIYLAATEMGGGDLAGIRSDGHYAGKMEIYIADLLHLGLLLSSDVCRFLCFQFHAYTLP